MIPISKSDEGNLGTSLSDEIVDDYKDRLASYSKSTSSSSQDHGGGNSFKYYYTNTATDAVEINQFTDYSLIEGGLPIYGEVGIIKEIRNSLSKEINGLTVCERIDKNVELAKEPLCYISYFGNKSSKIMSDLSDNISVDVRNDTSGEVHFIKDDENTRSFYIPYLGAKGRIIIYYRIIAKNAGMVLLGTSVRFDEKDYKDNDYYFKYKSEFPVDIIANVQKSKLFSGLVKPLGSSSTSITYDLEYRNASSKINNKFVNISIEGKSDCYEIESVAIRNYSLGSNPTVDRKYNYKNIDNKISFVLPFGKNEKISLIAKYFYEGENNIPYIFLDNTRFPEYPLKISVEDYINSRSSVIYLVIINIIGLIFTSAFAGYTILSNRKNNQNSLKVFSDHKKDHLDQINTSTNSIQKEITQINLNLNAISDKMDGIKRLEDLKGIAHELREIKEKLK